jgi:hypothetical protein
MSRHDNLPPLAKRIEVAELFRLYDFVEIPIIQRDYAQGRESAHEVRKLFLGALHDALASGNPLDLDFVYGHSVQRAATTIFQPLDGQQRLTTLFLLLWYLAWRDGALDDLQQRFKAGTRARLCYSVRQSSREFFDGLVQYTPQQAPQSGIKVSALITDEPWFFRSWKLDPTVHAALSMLDAIHDRFVGACGFYERLVAPGRSPVTFHHLDLGKFGLSDDLYIKMNARGRPLTVFETFKARLEQRLHTLFEGETMELDRRQVPIAEYFSRRIDKEWTDLFWSEVKHDDHPQVDQSFMSLFAALALVNRLPECDELDELDGLEQLRQPARKEISFGRYIELGCLQPRLIRTLISVLDSWSAGSEDFNPHMRDTDYFDAAATCRQVTRGSTQLTYELLVKFHAYSAFLARFRGPADPAALDDWMRVVCNLAEHRPYDNLHDLKQAIGGVDSLLEHAGAILEYLRTPGASVRGFRTFQPPEERLKAALLLKNPAWSDLIRSAERHGYFRGQVGFLLEFSGVASAASAQPACDWDELKDEGYRGQFASYFAKASAVFDGKGLVGFKDCKWERALLALGDYLPDVGANYSFLVNASRDASWKRLLRAGGDDDDKKRRALVQALFDRIEVGRVEDALDVVLKEVPRERWRRVIVEDGGHRLIEYGQYRMMRWLEEKETGYLLGKNRMTSTHAELFTYHLRLGCLECKNKRGELAPFSPGYREVTNGSEEPYAWVACQIGTGKLELQIHHEIDGFQLSFAGHLPAGLKSLLVRQPGCAVDDDSGGIAPFFAAAGRIEEVIDALVLATRQYLHEVEA